MKGIVPMQQDLLSKKKTKAKKTPRKKENKEEKERKKERKQVVKKASSRSQKPPLCLTSLLDDYSISSLFCISMYEKRLISSKQYLCG